MPPGIYIRTKPAWNKGIPYKHSGSFKKGHIPFNKGKKGLQSPPSPELVARLKIINSEYMKTNNPMFRSEVIEKHPIFKKEFRSEGEKIVEKILDEIKINFVSQYRVRREGLKSYFLDFYLPKFNVAIEFDGHSSHSLFPEKDIIRDKFIKDRYGIKTLRLRNVNSRSFVKFKIRSFIRCSLNS